MKGEAVLPYAEEILAFMAHRGGKDLLQLYADRSRTLIGLQREFEETGKYPASCYSEVRPINREEYNASLLLSFVTTHHRFEVLEQLVRFLKTPQEESSRMLAVGVGTGYEIKLAYDHLPGWEVLAFDTSAESIQYAADLLTFFGYPSAALRCEELPLERGARPEEYEGAFSKVILCEVLEHLEDPEAALAYLHAVLHPKGQLYLTMAINIAQEDHLYLYSNIKQARHQLSKCGWKIMHELVTPVTALPFREEERERVFRKGNYICVVERATPHQEPSWGPKS
jgi:SAM-dependent methyltransferase